MNELDGYISTRMDFLSRGLVSQQPFFCGGGAIETRAQYPLSLHLRGHTVDNSYQLVSQQPFYFGVREAQL